MKLKKVIPFAHSLLESAIKPGDIAIDATIGNGNDTAKLAELVGTSGKVYGFDIQEQALTNTLERLKKTNLQENVTLFHESHDKLKPLIPEELHGKVTAAIFNLGYLPGGDKHIVTTPESTIASIEQLLDIMAKEGLIILVIYHGHPEGQIERDSLINFLTTLDQNRAHILKYEFLNQKNNPPFIIAIEKK